MKVLSFRVQVPEDMRLADAFRFQRNFASFPAQYLPPSVKLFLLPTLREAQRFIRAAFNLRVISCFEYTFESAARI